MKKISTLLTLLTISSSSYCAQQASYSQQLIATCNAIITELEAEESPDQRHQEVLKTFIESLKASQQKLLQTKIDSGTFGLFKEWLNDAKEHVKNGHPTIFKI